MNDAMKEKLLEQLMEFLSMMPEKSEGSEEMPHEGKATVVAIDAEPKDEKAEC